ncbi:MAG: hypothetical protein GXX82_06860 [Syntrophorhabdus sp.]|nr:hypothetical protein [Syntrophorhabdus sp.]
MIYPQGKTIHQNLSAEYTDVPRLLSTLTGNGFSGVVEIEGGGTKGAFFIARGRMIDAVVGVDADPPSMTGDTAVPELFALARQPQGLLHVHELTAAQVEVATGSLRSELVFKDLSTDFIRVEQFVGKLGEEKHTGYIEISGKDGKRIGTLSLRAGEPVALQVLSESGQATLFEGEAIPSVLDNAVRHGALFNVYRSSGVTEGTPKAADAGPEGPDGISRKTTVSQTRAKRELKQVSDPAVEPEKKDDVPAGPVPAEERVEAPKEPPAPAPAPVDARAGEQEADDVSASGRKEFISALQRVLSKIESFVDHISKKGDFQRVFRRVCVDASDLFHFLDPFEGQFEYDSGRIRVDDTIGPDDLAVATAYCLNLVLADLNKEYLKGAALPPGLKGEIESAFRHYKDAIKNSGMNFVVPTNMR